MRVSLIKDWDSRVSSTICCNISDILVGESNQKSFSGFTWMSLLATVTMSSPVLEAVWNSVQPKLTEIRASLEKVKRENPHIIRVGQLDSELLDQELAQLLKEPINKALSLISVCFVAQLSQL